MNKLELLRHPDITRNNRVRLFKDSWSRWWSKNAPPLVWLFEETESVSETVKLLKQLGLYSFKKVSPKDSILYLTFKIIEFRKPDWIDAELAFYFDVAKETVEHGWTRCLETGKPTHKEWVTKKNGVVELYDIEVKYIEKDANLSIPDSKFWKHHKKRLENLRYD